MGFADAIERDLRIVLAVRELELAVARSERINWAELLERQEPPPPYRERACPHCASGRLGPRRLLCVDPVEGERWGHPWTMNHPGAADFTPERIERESTLIPGAFLCDRPSHGPFPLRNIEQAAQRLR